MSGSFDSARIARIADSIYAYWNLFPVDKVNIEPFFDNLKNLTQDSIVFAVCSKEASGFELVYHTFQDPMFGPLLEMEIRKRIHALSGQEIKLHENIFLFAFNYSFTQSPARACLEDAHNDDILAIKALFDRLNRDFPDLIAEVVNKIHSNREFNLIRYRQPIKSSLPENFILNKERYLDEISRLIEECTADVRGSVLLNTELAEGISIPKLFTVVAYPASDRRCDTFNYTAQVLLTRHQKAKISQWAGSDDFSKTLESPLSETSRFIADTPLCTGFVEYGETAGQGRDIAISPDEMARQKSEHKLYKAITGAKEEDGMTGFLIPIFLNGCPWIIFYTLSKADHDHDETWDHHYFLYRDVISKVGNTVRLRAKNTYFKLIESILRESLVGCYNAQEYVIRANEQFRQLSCFFPFPTPVLKTKHSSMEDSFFLNKVEFVRHTQYYNEFWDPYLEYDNLDPETLFSQSQDLLTALINSKEAENKKAELNIASYGSAHFYGNWLGAMNTAISNISRDIYRLPINDENRNKIQLLRNSLKEIKETNKGMRGVTKLVDLLAKRNTLPPNVSPYQFLGSDERFFTRDIFDLRQIIEQLCRTVGISLTDQINGKITVDAFLGDNKRLDSDFYSNIILEILYNCRKNNSCQVTIQKIVSDHKLTGISFTNSFPKPQHAVSHTHFREISTEEFRGAILYSHLFLKLYDLGKILYKKVYDDKAGHFEVQLILKHITYEN